MNSLSQLKSIRFNPRAVVLLDMAQCSKQWASLSLLPKMDGDVVYFILLVFHSFTQDDFDRIDFRFN